MTFLNSTSVVSAIVAFCTGYGILSITTRTFGSVALIGPALFFALATVIVDIMLPRRDWHESRIGSLFANF